MISGWSRVPLRELLTPVARSEVPSSDKSYRQIGVRLWGEGAYEREPINGFETKYAVLFRAEAGDVVANKIWARSGSVAVVPSSLAGCYGSAEFPMFAPRPNRLHPRWMHWLTKTRNFWEQCDNKSRGTSGKNRIRTEKFLEIEIPLPSVLDEQQRVVGRIEQLAARVQEARTVRQEADEEVARMLHAAFDGKAERAPRKPMAEVAPLVRRPVIVDAVSSYPELGIRSFGRGTFHKPALSGLEVGSKRLFRIEPADLLFNNVFAWEGAVAVAKPEDSGRYGSHRFITCVPKPGVANSQFLCFYFLTSEGLERLGKASPGGALRNRTLGLEALANIQVPAPSFESQTWFASVCSRAETLKRSQEEVAADLGALLPSILDRAFNGEL